MKTQLTHKDKGDGAIPLIAQRSKEAEALDGGRVDVAILMCTYNGANWLQEQLESFNNQSHKDWTLYVSDDASTDATRRILADYQQRWGEHRLIVFDGPCQGFGKNFISLLKRPEVNAHYYAFSDQDDVWFSDKLQRSIARIAPLAEKTPALYCSRTRLIDEEGKPTGYSPLFSRPPSFQNALVQSLAGANTMLINHAAREVLLQTPEDATVVAHDWLAYILITGCGGVAIYDAEASLDYRQHGGNLIGANASLGDRIARFGKMLTGRFVEWNDSNLQILNAMSAMLTPQSRTSLQHFNNGRCRTVLGRLSELRQSGIYRQTPEGNFSLIIAACLGRI